MIISLFKSIYILPKPKEDGTIKIWVSFYGTKTNYNSMSTNIEKGQIKYNLPEFKWYQQIYWIKYENKRIHN